METSHEPGSNHHYVPRFYLNGFKDKKGVLWVYEKGAATPRQSTSKKEGNREDYYTFTEFGERDDSAEHMLGKVEGLVAPVFHDLRRRVHKMSPEQVGSLFAFLGILFARVPAYREYWDKMAAAEISLHARAAIQTPGNFEKFLRYYETKEGKPLADPDLLRRAVIDGEFTYQQKSAVMNLAFVFRDARKIGEELIREYSYDLFYSPQGMFYVTSDNPIVTVGPKGEGNAMVGVGFSWPNTQVIFPVNKRVCAILSREGGERKIDATPEKFREINRLLMFAAQTCVFASEDSAELIREFKQHGCGLAYGQNAFLPFSLAGD